MSLSPTLERFLALMEYPATRDDLLREAVRDGLSIDDIRSLRRIRNGSYDARYRVLSALRETELVSV